MSDKLQKLLAEMKECDESIKQDLGVIPVEFRPGWVARQNMAIARKEALGLEYQTALANQGTYILLAGTPEQQERFATLAKDYANCLVVDCNSLYTGIASQMRNDCVGRLFNFSDLLDMVLGVNTYLVKLGLTTLLADTVSGAHLRTFNKDRTTMLADIKSFTDSHVPDGFWERFVTKLPHDTIRNLSKDSNVIPIVVTNLNPNLLDKVDLNNRTVVRLPNDVVVDRTVVFTALDEVRSKLTTPSDSSTVEAIKAGATPVRRTRRLEQ